MFTHHYLRLKTLKRKLLDRFNKKEKTANQDIFIRDIFVYPNLYKNSFGEF